VLKGPAANIPYEQLRELRAVYISANGDGNATENGYFLADKFAEMDYGRLKFLFFVPGLLFSVGWMAYVLMRARALIQAGVSFALILLAFVVMPTYLITFMVLIFLANAASVGLMGATWLWSHSGKVIDQEWNNARGDFNATKESLIELTKKRKINIGSIVSMLAVFIFIFNLFSAIIPTCNGWGVKGTGIDIIKSQILSQYGFNRSSIDAADISISNIETTAHRTTTCACTADVKIHINGRDVEGYMTYTLDTNQGDFREYMMEVILYL
jgi:hypothetical protein